MRRVPLTVPKLGCKVWLVTYYESGHEAKHHTYKVLANDTETAASLVADTNPGQLHVVAVELYADVDMIVAGLPVVYPRNK